MVAASDPERRVVSPPMDDAKELARLRERVVELEQQLAKVPGAVGESTHRSPWWAVLSAVCIIVGCALAPVSVASVWARSTLVDTDTFATPSLPSPGTLPSRRPWPTP
jgi:hypothetical protein